MAEEDSQMFPLTPHAVAYAWRQLAQRAGITPVASSGTGFETLDIPVAYTQPNQLHFDRPGLIVIPCRPTGWGDLLARAPHTLTWLPIKEILPSAASTPLDQPLPILFWGEGAEAGQKPFAEVAPSGSVIFHADLIATTFFMLSRWEETVVPIRDEHGRFPAMASVAYKQGFLDQPIVDQYALILSAWLKVLLPGWQPNPCRFTVKLSHDIDTVRVAASLPGVLKRVGGDLLKRRSLRQAWQTGLDFIWQTWAPERTSAFQGIYRLAELSRRYGLASAFYFMTANPGPPENDYELTSPLIKKCITDLYQQGFEIGFHPGYHTLNQPERLAAEKSRLDAVLGKTGYGGRQHCLRFQVPHTWRHWEQLGLAYDSTLTYADHEGFRCGTCHCFHPFDLEQDRQLNLKELPLIVMDVTLKRYRYLTPEQGQARIMELAWRCHQVNGTFTLLWHNSSLAGEWLPWAKIYQQVIKLLAELEAQFTT